MRSSAVSRRQALLGVAAGLTGLAVSIPAGARAASDPIAARNLRTKLATALGLSAQAVAVWFEGAPGRQLADDARTGTGSFAQFAALTVPELRAQLRQLILRDYAAGRIVSARGWFLSQTEVLVLHIIHGEKT